VNANSAASYGFLLRIALLLNAVRVHLNRFGNKVSISEVSRIMPKIEQPVASYVKPLFLFWESEARNASGAIP
jgi:hypothetical protein